MVRTRREVGLSEVRRYVVAAAGDPDQVVAELADRVGLVAAETVDLERTFLDTADGRMVGAGTVLELRRPTDGGRPALLWTARGSGEVLARIDLDGRAAPPWFAEDLPAVPARRRLAGLLEMRALLDQGQRRCRLTTLVLVDAEEKTTARVVVDRPLPGAADDGEEPPVDPGPVVLEVVPVRGYDQAWGRVVRVLDAQVVLRPVAEDAATCARRAVTDAPYLSSKLRLSLDPSSSAAEAWRAVARALTATMDDNLEGTLAGTDTEFLHDYRVAVRRMRSVLSEGRRVLPPGARAHFREQFRWLGDVTTPTRDADVHLLDLPDLLAALPADRAASLGPLQELLVERQAACRAQLVADLRSPRYAELLESWHAFLDDPAAWPAPATDDEPSDPDRPDAARPAPEVAAARLARAHRRLRRDGRLIDDSSPPQALHDLRKDAKRLRYLLECFGSLLPAADVAAAVRALKSLQDVLGEFQDSEVQAEELARAGDELVGRPGVPAATLLAMGALVEHLEARRARARRRFAGRFARFDSSDVGTVFRRLATGGTTS